MIVLSFYAGQATNKPDLNHWNFIVELATVLAGVGTVGMLIIAYQAMVNWKRQLSQSIIINTAIEIEDKLTKYYLACISNDPSKLSETKGSLLSSDIVLLSWRLKRRGFSLTELNAIELSIQGVAESIRTKREISDAAANNVLKALHSFSKTF